MNDTMIAMNGDILFRGKIKDTHEWVYGYYFKDLDGCVSIINSDGNFLIDVSTLGRFTGADDNNGNHIFEGDIIFTGTNRYNCSDQYGNRKLYWEVHYRQGSFYLIFLGVFINSNDTNINDYKKLMTLSTDFSNPDHDDYVVIGNKYDMSDNIYNVFFDTLFVPTEKLTK